MKEEKKMKKIVTLIMVAIMLCTSVFALASCGEDGLDAAYNKYIKEYTFNDKDLPTLTVATSPDFAPMEFVDAAKSGQEQYVGFDIILAHYLAKELNMKLEIKPMSFDACMVAVQTGQADLAISGFSWTPVRAENFLISDWYKAGENETEQIIITTKANEGKFTTKESFRGMKIGAQGSSLQETLVKENFVDTGIASISQYVNLDDALTDLISGKIDALAVAAGNGDAFISKNPDKVATSGFQFDVEEKYKNNVILLNKTNNELLEKVNAALGKAKEANLYDPWYEACQIYSEIKTADQLGYDDKGNKITSAE